MNAPCWLDLLSDVLTTGIGALLGAWFGARFAYRDAREHAREDARLARRQREADLAEQFAERCSASLRQAIRDSSAIKASLREGTGVDPDIVQRARDIRLIGSQAPTLVGSLKAPTFKCDSAFFALFVVLYDAVHEPSQDSSQLSEAAIKVATDSGLALASAIERELAELYPDLVAPPKR